MMQGRLYEWQQNYTYAEVLILYVQDRSFAPFTIRFQAYPILGNAPR